MKKGSKWFEFCSKRVFVVGWITTFLLIQLASVCRLVAEGTFWGVGSASFINKSLLVRYLDWCMVTCLSAMTSATVSVIITLIIWMIGWLIIDLAKVIAKASEEKQSTSC